jgi:hypothetical protein
MIRDRASPVISATAATPPHPAARASLAANTRLPRSSRFEPSAQFDAHPFTRNTIQLFLHIA